MSTIPEEARALSQNDFMERGALSALQLERLKATVAFAYQNQKLFRQRMDERGLGPDCVKDLTDIQKLPFFTKIDLRDTYPFGLLCIPMKDVARLHASSGTTGKPIVVPSNRNDLEIWRSAVCRALVMIGLGQEDVLQNSYGYGLFTGGLGLHDGGEKLGLTVLPTSSGNTERQLRLMKDFGVTAISCTPSYFIYMIEKGKELGIEISSTKLRHGIFGAEPWTAEMRARIEAESGIHAWDIYGLTEICGPGVAMECPAHAGLHVFEDYFYPEVINSETGEALPDGEEGELVLTTLCKRAMPLIRYRTRDVSVILPEKCECGRTIRRIKRIDHRNDDMLIIRGVNVFPSQIEAALLTVEGVQPYYHIVVSRKGDLDDLEVKVEVSGELLGDTIRTVENLQKRIANAVKTTIGLAVKITLVEPGSLSRSEGKAKRVTDLRKSN